MRASVSLANLLSISYNINGTVSGCVCVCVSVCVHAWQHIWWFNASTRTQVFCTGKPLIPGAPLDESDYSNKSPCHSMHNALGLCRSHLAYLYACHCVQEAWSYSLCQYDWDKTIWLEEDEKKAYIHCVAPVGWTWIPWGSFIYREALWSWPPPTSRLATHITVTSHNTSWHLSDWLTDFMFELSESNRIGWHPVTRVWLDDIVFVPGDSGLIGWHFAWPIRVILSGLVCFDAVWLDGLVRW